MKSTYKAAALLLTSVALLSSCRGKSSEVINPSNQVLKVISSDISWLRTNGNVWSAGDEIGIYAFGSGEEFSDASLYDGKANVKFVTQGGNGAFTHSETPINLTNRKSVDIVAYYPYSSEIKEYKYAFDNSDQSDHAKIDLLYAQAKGLNAEHHEATMSFNHMLTRIDFIINPNGHDLSTPEVTCNDVIVDGTMLITDGSITTGTKTANLSITATKKGEAQMIGSMILPPQTYEGKKIVLTVGDKKIESALPTFTTKSGYRYEVTLNYVQEGDNKTEMRVAVSNISDWNEGEKIPAIDVKEPKITVEVKEVTVTPATASLKIGEEIKLAYSVLPENATDKTVVWESSDEKIATVVNATVKALTAGKATITATSKNGKKGTCTVTVETVNPDKSIPDVPGVNL